MNDELDAVALVSAGLASATVGGAWYLFIDLNIIIPIIVSGLLTLIFFYRNKHKRERFPRTDWRKK